MTATPLVGSTFFGLDISQLGKALLAFRRHVSKRVLLIEFCSDALLLAEAMISEQGVALSHLSRIDLPAEAFERGVPASPARMARLIQDFCAEKKIPANRAAVVIPPEVAFHRSVELPAGLCLDQTRTFVLDPANGVQLPFPLIQTDFDLFPLTTPSTSQQRVDTQHYMIAAAPQVLVDRVVQTLELAEMELQGLELGSHSLLRGMAPELLVLSPMEVILVLELLPECSNLLQASCSGLFATERLSSIRDFPCPEMEDDAVRLALEHGESAENVSIQCPDYLPLSALDLRVLTAEINEFLQRFHQSFPGGTIRCLRLTGINSAHPLLVDLLSDALDIPVEAYRPLLAPGIAGFKADDLLVQANLGRLAGLALSLLTNDELISCHKDGPLPGSEQANEAMLKDIPDLPQFNAADVLKPVPFMSAAPESDATPLPVLEDVEVVDDIQQEEPLPSVVDVVEVEKVEASQVEALKGEEEEGEEVEVEMEMSEESWPSIGGLKEVKAVEEKNGEEEEVEMSEESWPSIGGLKEVEVVEEKRGEEVEAEMSEESWPSIGGLKEVEAIEKLKVAVHHLQGETSAQHLEPQEREASLLVIPGLERVAPADRGKALQSDDSVVGDQADDDMESLGELRFADPD